MNYVENGRARLAYQMTAEPGADQAPVLLVMGFLMPHTAWGMQVPTLSRHHPVATLDNRGSGATEAPAGPYSMGVLASDARAVIDDLGWPDVHLVGVSMGGMIAQNFALKYPDRVRSLSLIATHPGGWKARLPPRKGWRQFVRANVMRDRVEGALQLLFPPEFLASTDLNGLRTMFARDLGPGVAGKYKLSQLRAIMRHDTRKRLAELSMPTLVVKPGHDNLIDPRNSDRLVEGIPHAKLRVFSDAGHGLIRQCADDLNAALLAHFAEADAGRARFRPV